MPLGKRVVLARPRRHGALDPRDCAIDAIGGGGLIGHAIGIARLCPTARRIPGGPVDDSTVSPQRPAHSSTHRSPRDDPGRAGQASDGCPVAVSPTKPANANRALSMDAVEAATSGPPGIRRKTGGEG